MNTDVGVQGEWTSQTSFHFIRMSCPILFYSVVQAVPFWVYMCSLYHVTDLCNKTWQMFQENREKNLIQSILSFLLFVSTFSCDYNDSIECGFQGRKQEKKRWKGRRKSKEWKNSIDLSFCGSSFYSLHWSGIELERE